MITYGRDFLFFNTVRESYWTILKITITRLSENVYFLDKINSHERKSILTGNVIRFTENDRSHEPFPNHMLVICFES